MCLRTLLLLPSLLLVACLPSSGGDGGSGDGGSGDGGSSVDSGSGQDSGLTETACPSFLPWDVEARWTYARAPGTGDSWDLSLEISTRGLVEKENEQLLEVYWYLNDENPNVDSSVMAATQWLRCDAAGISLVHDEELQVVVSGGEELRVELTRAYDPPMLVLPLTLEVGDAWEVSTTATGTKNGNPVESTIERSFTVNRADTVATPSAIFDTLVVTEIIRGGPEVRFEENHYAAGVGLVRWKDQLQLVDMEE